MKVKLDSYLSGRYYLATGVSLDDLEKRIEKTDRIVGIAVLIPIVLFAVLLVFVLLCWIKPTFADRAESFLKFYYVVPLFLPPLLVALFMGSRSYRLGREFCFDEELIASLTPNPEVKILSFILIEERLVSLARMACGFKMLFDNQNFLRIRVERSCINSAVRFMEEKYVHDLDLLDRLINILEVKFRLSVDRSALLDFVSEKKNVGNIHFCEMESLVPQPPPNSSKS